MKLIETAIPDVKVIEPAVFADERGFFMESYHKEKFAQFGITCDFVQDNHSRSAKGILRGLHYQVQQTQDKLCRVAVGEVLDVAVDIRKGSPTFGEWVSVLLTAENKRMIFVPKGFAHGFVVLSDVAEFLYKCSDFYHQPSDRGVLWNDPDIGIDWGIDFDPILSAKDQNHPQLKNVPDEDLPMY